ncbi:Zinc finger BED domain containing protein 5 [Dissostichus eleginoides]|uniref:Zinc finger BED domain containing protein 5 n=1 Tax=Dissostichus eleginoides TaxID=100907 RepID=A0AAD9CG23_DISEL|nr:Zinc finger BED domain containing protein 5 [Dissostichus eleginoides]
MAEDVKKTLIERIKSSSYYSIQLDETTDVADLANLMVYVRYEHDGAAQEEFLFCQPLETRTTAELIFQLLDAFVQENGLEWKKCVGVCTDGARAMTGRHSGVAARIKEVAPEMRWTHCSIHREALAVKKMPDGLNQLAYLSDIFSRLNDLNLGLQGLSINVFDVQDKINTMLKKLELFQIKVKAGDVSAFPALESFLSENELTLDDGVRDNMVAHLVSLRQQFRQYFPVMTEDNSWMRSPFSMEASGLPKNLTVAEQESVIELSCDETLKPAFRKQSLVDFWIKQHREYPALSDKAVRFLLPFATTYLCEKGFSSLAVIKTKYRSRLNAEPDLRLKLTSIAPDIKGLCSRRQAQPSH